VVPALLDTVRAVLVSDGWKLLELPDGVGLVTTITTDDASWPLVVLADEEDQVVICYSVFPGRVPPGRRRAAAELLTRVNYGLAVGVFELDLDDGEVRLRTSLDVGAQPPSPDLVRSLVGRNVTVAERHFPAVEAFLADADASLEPDAPPS
jgi:hypothetical protein